MKITVCTILGTGLILFNLAGFISIPWWSAIVIFFFDVIVDIASEIYDEIDTINRKKKRDLWHKQRMERGEITKQQYESLTK